MGSRKIARSWVCNLSQLSSPSWSELQRILTGVWQSTWRELTSEGAVSASRKSLKLSRRYVFKTDGTSTNCKCSSHSVDIDVLLRVSVETQGFPSSSLS